MKEFQGITGHIEYMPTTSMIISILFIVILLIAVGLLQYKKLVSLPVLALKKRVLFSVGSLLVAGMFLFGFLYNDSVNNLFGFDNQKTSLKNFYNNNGFINSYLYKLKELNTVEELKTATNDGDKVIQQQNEYFAAEPEVTEKPTIIVILSESQKDISNLEGVQFSTDLMPFTHTLTNQSNAYVTNMISPTYGWGTSNIEYDVITGNSTSDYAESEVAYSSHISHPFFSLPQLLKTYGYTTTAIHPYYANFYDRDKAYPNIGVDQFIAIDQFTDAKMIGDYVSDDSFSDKIISEYQNKSGQPQFILGISMENHGGYPNEKFQTDSPVRIVDKGVLSDSEAKQLEIYGQGVYDADQSLKKLTEYFSTVNEPVVIVQFGDHSPSLAEVMEKLGHSKDDTDLTSLLFNYTTPLVFWSNMYEINLSDFNYISADNVAPLLLSQTPITLPPYYDFKLNMIDNVGMPLQDYYIDQNGAIIPVSVTGQEYINTYQYLQNYFLTKDTTFLKTNEQIILTPTRENE